MYSKIALFSQKFIRSFISLLFPNHCTFCGVLLERSACICDNCLKEVGIIDKAVCKRCGAPVKHEFEVHVCSQCEGIAFGFRMNESLGVYTGTLQELIHQYKFGKRRSLYSLFSDLIIRYKNQYILDHEILLPMPLTRTRFSERGFNQSYLIAREVSCKLQVIFYGDIIRREGDSRPQSSIQSRKDRWLNISDQFAVKGRWRDKITGRNVLLFDDVLTTGATASACARMLYREGARNVDVLTLGRALMEPGDVYF